MNGTPTNYRAVRSTDGKSLACSWSYSSYEGVGAVHHLYRPVTLPESSWVSVAIGVVTSHAIEGLDPTLEYESKVEAFDYAGSSNIVFSPPVKVEPTPVPTPIPPLPSVLGLSIALCGLIGWGPKQESVEELATHVRRDRIDCGGGLSAEQQSQLSAAVARGVIPLCIYNPGLKGMTPAAVAAGVKALIGQLVACGLPESEIAIECGNEQYFTAIKPAEYAGLYKAAREVTQPLGVPLLANYWGDYQRADGTWSQTSSGNGWAVDLCKALGFIPDRWSIHNYGPMTASGQPGSGTAAGWLSVPTAIAFLKQHSIFAPLWITESGEPTFQGTDGNHNVVSEAQQAIDIKTRMKNVVEWAANGDVEFFSPFEALDSAEGGYGFWKRTLEAKPAAAAFGEAIAAAGLSNS